MQVHGLFNFAMTTVLFITLVGIVIHYYRPKRKEDVEQVEQPKYTMLKDDDEDGR